MTVSRETSELQAGDTEKTVVLPGTHPGQEVVEGMLGEHRFVMLMCGRRWGKTKYGMRWLAMGALNGERCGWFAPTYKYAGDAWRELVIRLRPAAVSVSNEDKRIELQGGGVIEVWTMDGEDPARGRKYNRVVLDEAGIVKGLTNLWQSSVRPTLTDERGKALFLGTPKGLSGEFSRMFTQAQRMENGWAGLRRETSDNPWIDPEEIAAAKAELPEEIFDQEYRGIPADDGGNPFGLKAIADATMKGLAQGPAVVYGLDLARSGDYSVVLGLNAQCEVCVLERWQFPWLDTRRKIAQVVGQVPCVADATGVGDAVVEDLQTMGITVTGFKFTQPSKTLLMQRLMTAFQTRFLKICEEWLVGECEMFGYTFTPNGVRYEAPSGMHDDGVMALGLAMYGWDRVQMSKPLVPGTDGLVFVKADDPDLALSRQHRDITDSLNQLPSGW